MSASHLTERGATALRAGDLAAAERLCLQVLQNTPEDCEALNILGAIAFTRRDFAAAERHFARAAKASPPENLGALFNLAKVFEVQRRFDDAADAYVKILRLNANHVETRLRLGIVRYQQDRLDESARLFEKVLQTEPHNATAALSLGVTYNAQGRFEESVRALRALIEEEPDLIDAYHALSDSLCELHRADDAAEVASAALAHDPSDVMALVLLGQAEVERHDYAKAERLFRQAAAFSPDRSEPQMNLGVLFQRLGRIDEALLHGAKAVELAGDDPLAHFNYGMGLLLGGHFARGWPELEWRMLDRKLRPHFPYRDRLPLWTGEAQKEPLLVAREQGIGDFILFARFFPQLKAHGAQRVIVEAPAEVASLFRDAPGVDEIVADRIAPERLDGVASHIPVCSLPFVLGIDERGAGAGVPYVNALPESASRFRTLLAPYGDRFKIGIVWAGSPGHALDRYRSCALSEFAALADLEGLTLVSLQKGDGARAELARVAFEVVDISEELRDFDDTAGALDALDLVISVDTAVAHLAGAMARPVWLLSGFGSYYLWQLSRPDSPWYPTMRIFRQAEPAEWKEMFGQVRDVLTGLLETRA